MYTNASEGIRKIYTGYLLGLIASAITLVAAVIVSSAGNAAATSEVTVAGVGAMALIAGVLMLVGAIMNIMGVNRASRDEASFRNALIALAAGFAANLLAAAFGSSQVIGYIGKAVSNVTEILVSYYICTGIINLADRVPDGDVSTRGKRIRSILMGIWIASACLNLLVALSGSNLTMQTVAGVIAIVVSLISLVAYFFYLGLLGRAKQMLAR